MSYDKRALSHYNNFQGINQKGSKYTLDNAQATDLKNLDFFVPNAWTKREGSTQMISAPGITEPVTMMYEYQKLDGSSFVLLASDKVLYKKTGLSATSLSTGWGGSQCIDALTFVNRAWLANGVKTQSFDGTSAFVFGLPTFQNTFSIGNSFIAIADQTNAFSVMGVTCQVYSGIENLTNIKSILYMGIRYLRSDGYWGPGDFNATNIVAITPFVANAFAPRQWLGMTSGICNYGGNLSLAINIGNALAPTGYGITAIGLYLAIDTFTNNPSIGYNSSTNTPPNYFHGRNDVDQTLFHFFTYIPYGFSQDFISIFGITSWTAQILNGQGPGFSHESFSGMAFDFFSTYTPRYIEITDNRFMLGGFSSNPSTIWFSEIGEPENYQETSFLEVRTNDGDSIRALKTFQDELLVFKRYSFHKLIGDSPDNYQLVQLSTEYGCLSNKAIVEFNNQIMFLDEKGIVNYNGANWSIASGAVEDVFRRMNVSAAIDQAVAVHNALRNQVWFSIPVDGSTKNNMTVVYDYLVNGWTFFEGFSPASLAPVTGTLNVRRTHFGDYSGMIHHFSPTFMADNGVGITCYALTKFDAPDGQNIENMYRQLFLDVNPVTGGTGVVDCRVFSNYDSSTVRATFAIYQNQFQTRRDFGVPGKSAAFDFKHFSATHSITIYGYTVRRRYLRDV